MRSLTTGQQTAVRAKNVRPVWFVRLDTTVPQYLCTAYQSLDWNGFTWRGFGRVAFVEFAEENTEAEGQPLRIGVAGVDASVLASYEDSQVQGKACTVWTGLYGDDYKLIDTPVQEYAGKIDVPATEESARSADGRVTATISITVESRYWNGSRARVFRYTDAAQRARYPSDGTLRHIPSMVEQVLDHWGRGVR